MPEREQEFKKKGDRIDDYAVSLGFSRVGIQDFEGRPISRWLRVYEKSLEIPGPSETMVPHATLDFQRVGEVDYVTVGAQLGSGQETAWRSSWRRGRLVWDPQAPELFVPVIAVAQVEMVEKLIEDYRVGKEIIQALGPIMAETLPDFPRFFDDYDATKGVYFVEGRGKRPGAIRVTIYPGGIEISFGRGGIREKEVDLGIFDRSAIYAVPPIREYPKENAWPVSKDNPEVGIRAAVGYLNRKLEERWEGEITRFEEVMLGGVAEFAVVRTTKGAQVILDIPSMGDWRKGDWLVKPKGEIRIRKR